MDENQIYQAKGRIAAKPENLVSGGWLAQQMGDRGVELLQVAFHDAPHEIEVDTEVIVRETIPHSCDLLPRNLGSARSGCLRKSLDCLADDLELSDHGILLHSVGEECRLASRSVALDVVDGIPDVPEIDALVLHRARASAVIR